MSINKIGLLKTQNMYLNPYCIAAIVENDEDYPSIRMCDGRSYKFREGNHTIDSIAQKMLKAIETGKTIDLEA